ncbi:hypothetical protein JCM8547_006365 [Rhodosporidiobolus lusitaniae]
MGYRLHLSLLSLVVVGLFLAWHFRACYIDYLPRSVSSRVRHYAPLSTFEDAAEQGFSTSSFDSRATWRATPGPTWTSGR